MNTKTEKGKQLPLTNIPWTSVLHFDTYCSFPPNRVPGTLVPFFSDSLQFLYSHNTLAGSFIQE